MSQVNLDLNCIDGISVLAKAIELDSENHTR